MKREIKLNSRGGIDNRLVQVKGEPLKYELKTEFNYRVGFTGTEPREYTFIDPDGGPFISVGSEIDGHKVKTIHEKGIIEFES